MDELFEASSEAGGDGADDCWVIVKSQGKMDRDTFKCKKSWKVADLKEQIEKDMGILVARQTVIFDMDDTSETGHTLEDDLILADVFELAGETEGVRLNLALDISGGGPAESGKRGADSKEKRMKEIEEKVETSLLKLGALGQQHPVAVTCYAHVTHVQQALGSENPMEALLSNLGMAETKALQNVLTSGREDSRMGAICKVLFAQDMATSDSLKKLGTTLEAACGDMVKQVFYETYMSESGVIQWSLFTKYINNRLLVLANAAGEARAAAAAASTTPAQG